MKIRTLTLFCFLTIIGSSIFAQEKSLFESLTETTNKSERFKLSLLTQASFYNSLDKGGSHKFKFNQLRIEARGKINDVFSYRWRQRLNRGNSGGNNIDNLPSSIDFAGIGVNLGSKFSLFLGKQITAYGGMEQDANPIEIYQFADILDYMSCFLTGIDIAYKPVENQEIRLQILDSRNGSLEATYGGQGLADAELPLLYTLNWNGNFNDIFKTRWSISHMTQSKNENLFFIALGNSLTIGKSETYFDAMYSLEGVDRKGIMTSLTQTKPQGHNLHNTEYMAFILSTKYEFIPSWKLHLKGMYETAGLTEDIGSLKSGKYRDSYGYVAGIEYYPMTNSNMHFFINYVGRNYKFTDKIIAADYNTNSINLGFVYMIPMI